MLSNPITITDAFLKALNEVKTSGIEPDKHKHIQEDTIDLPGGGKTTCAALKAARDVWTEKQVDFERSGHWQGAAHAQEKIREIDQIQQRHDQDWTRQVNAALNPAAGSVNVPHAPNGGQIPPTRRVQENAPAGPSAVPGDEANEIRVNPDGTTDKKILKKTGMLNGYNMTPPRIG